MRRFLFSMFLIPGLYTEPGSELDRALQKLAGQIEWARDNLKFYICREEVIQDVVPLHGGGSRVREKGTFEFRVLDGKEERSPLTRHSRSMQNWLTSLGGFSAAIDGVVSPEAQQIYQYRLQRRKGKLEVSTSVPRELSLTYINHVPVAFDATILLEGPNRRISKFNRTVQLPGGERLRHVVEYRVLTLGGEEYNLPVKQQIEIEIANRFFSTVYRYSKCKRFSSETKLRFESSDSRKKRP